MRSPAIALTVSSLTAKAKVERLRKLFKHRKRGLVLTHDNPDPDSMASAVALATVLHSRLGIPTDVAYGGIIGRAENSAFVRVLKLPVLPISQVDPSQYDLFALVDTQQSVKNHSLPEGVTADIVIDHHPTRDDGVVNPFADLGSNFYGATSTLLTEYVRAARIEPMPELATALYYGIKADTRDLERQTREPDVDCYLWLFPRIDRNLLAEIEHPQLPLRYFRLFHAAIEKARLFTCAVITDLGEVYSPDMVAEVAERLSFLEEAKWSLASGSFRSQLYLSLRCSDRRMNAGRLIREVCEGLGGSAGGHGSMAGARLPLVGKRANRAELKREVVRRFKAAFGVEGERGVSLLSDET
ncbi:MAG: DHH family phosphoesterase [Myxococcales bacterium]|nr:DHH family phosphoesterase [Myxococcales bacterium]MDP3502813.1 DHH family phosphoesterase [Myxococcales bacterium]